MSSYVIKREKVEQRQTADKDKVDHDKQKKYIDKKPDIVINTNGDGSINIHSHTLFPEPAAIFQQSLSKIVYGGGEINEMFTVAKKCGNGGNTKLWYKYWDALASKTFDDAQDRFSVNPVAASKTFLRACTYFQTSSKFLFNCFDEKSIKQLRNAYSCSDLAFNMAIPNLPYAMKKYLIPHTSKLIKNAINSYFFCANQALHGFKGAPLLIATSGYYGDIAETFFLSRGAIEYGFHLLIFDGPGTICERDEKTRQNEWEKKALQMVINYVIDQRVIDLKDGIICYGMNTGGVPMILRNAMIETRPIAYLIDSIVPDVVESLHKKHLKKNSKLKPEEFEKLKVPVFICENGHEEQITYIKNVKKSLKKSIVQKESNWVKSGATNVISRELLWENYIDKLLPLLKKKIKH